MYEDDHLEAAYEERYEFNDPDEFDDEPDLDDEDSAAHLPGGNSERIIRQAFNDYQDDMPCEDKYDSYWQYVDDQVGNYEHLIRTEPNPDGSDREFLEHLYAEQERVYPSCGACGLRHPADRPQECDLYEPPDTEECPIHGEVPVLSYETAPSMAGYGQDGTLRLACGGFIYDGPYSSGKVQH